MTCKLNRFVFSFCENDLLTLQRHIVVRVGVSVVVVCVVVVLFCVSCVLWCLYPRYSCSVPS
jgi:hypothetical protein